MFEIKNLNLTLDKFSLKNINLKSSSKKIAILGKSGSGKTVFLETIAGKYNPSGNIILNYRHLEKTPPQEKKINLVYQNFNLFPFLNVFENIVFSQKILNENKYAEKAIYLMKKLDIYHLKENNINFLSGGEKQRVCLCRALMKNPELLLLDEPFSALDCINKSSAMNITNDIIKEFNFYSILVTHNVDECLEFAEEIYFMKNGFLSDKFLPCFFKKIVQENKIDEYI